MFGRRARRRRVALLRRRPPLSRAGYRRSWWRRDPRQLATGLIVSIVLLAVLATKAYGGLHAEPRTVRVHAGDTLWSIAASHYDSDLRDRMADIASLNDISGGNLYAGEVLMLP